MINSPRGFLSQLRPGPAHDLGGIDHECEFCQALHFVHEQTAADKLFESCCKRGDAVLDRLREPPAYLRTLYEAQTTVACNFR